MKGVLNCCLADVLSHCMCVKSLYDWCVNKSWYVNKLFIILKKKNPSLWIMIEDYLNYLNQHIMKDLHVNLHSSCAIKSVWSVWQKEHQGRFSHLSCPGSFVNHFSSVWY